MEKRIKHLACNQSASIIFDMLKQMQYNIGRYMENKNIKHVIIKHTDMSLGKSVTLQIIGKCYKTLYI